MFHIQNFTQTNISYTVLYISKNFNGIILFKILIFGQNPDPCRFRWLVSVGGSEKLCRNLFCERWWKVWFIKRLIHCQVNKGIVALNSSHFEGRKAFIAFLGHTKDSYRENECQHLTAILAWPKCMYFYFKKPSYSGIITVYTFRIWKCCWLL